MRSNLFRCGVAVATVTALFFSGCALQPSPTPSASSAVAVSTPRTQFSLSGRFSAKNGKAQASGQFRYAQTSPSGTGSTTRQLSLFSPLGTPLGEINADGQSATLMLANGSVQRAASLTDLMRTVIDLPVTDATLSAWLQGLPLDATLLTAASAERDSLGALSRFVELGWEITISARMDGPTAAPKRMLWAMLGQPDTEVRWVIDEGPPP